MPTTELTDDQIADAIADEVVARIANSHPNASSKFRRLLVKLYTAQAVGAERQPGRISDARLASYFGEAPQRISETRSAAMARAWQTYHEQCPDLLNP